MPAEDWTPDDEVLRCPICDRPGCFGQCALEEEP